MTIETPPEIDDLPPSPSRMNDGEAFSPKMDTWLAAQPQWNVQLTALGNYVYDTAVTVQGLASGAEQSASNAASQVQLAANQVQLAADEVSNAQAVADSVAAQANFGGQWGDLTGSVAPPLSVYHAGQYWQLLVPLADVTSVEPGSDVISWIPMVETTVDIGQIVYSFKNLEATGLFIKPGASYLQSEYPELYSLVGLGIAVPNVDVTDIVGTTPSLPYGLSWSIDGGYLFVGTTANNFVYARSGDALTQIFTSADGGARKGAISRGGTYFVTGNVSDGTLKFYKWDGSQYTSIAAPAQTPTDGVIELSFDESGTYLVVVSSGVNKVIVYKRSGDTFTVIEDTLWNTGTGQAVTASFGGENGQYLAVGRSSSGGLTVYENDADSFVVFESGLLSGKSIVQSQMSVTAEYIAAITNESVESSNGGAYILRLTSGSYTTIESPVSGNNSLEVVAISPAGDVVVTGGGATTDGLSLATISGNVVEYQTPPGSDATPRTYAVSASDFYLALGTVDDTFKLYRGDYPFDIETEFYVPDIAPLPAVQVGGWNPGVQPSAYVRAK